MMTYLTLGPFQQSTEKSCQGYLLDDIESSLIILEKFLTATIMKVKQQWPREIRISMFQM